MELTRIISKIFDEQAEEANRILIVTKGTRKKDLEKYEKDINKEKNPERAPKDIIPDIKEESGN